MAKHLMICNEAMSVLNQAILNNAQWCDTVCRAHGAPGHFSSCAWVNFNTTPSLYPNMVTTNDDTANQLSTVELLMEIRPNFPHAVKDSFSRLDLGPCGFIRLFSAQWYARLPAPVPNNLLAKTSEWKILANASGLAAWERAWRTAGNHEDILQSPMFPVPFLKEPGMFFLAGHASDAINAGAIAYEASGVIAVTNFFSKCDDNTQEFAACLNCLRITHPEATIVGYERESTLSEFSSLNLQRLGPLCVWLR